MIGVLIVGGVFAVAVLATGRTSSSTAEQVSAVSVTDGSLAPLPNGTVLSDRTTDPAAGTVAPTLSGTDFAGNDITIEPDGRAKAIYFVAHWCPHCQEEVPAIQELIDDGQLPENVDVYAVSTGVDQSRGNYPPETWLTDEGFAPPTVRDSAASDAFMAFGGSGFPYAVYLDENHQVVARSAGQTGPDAIRGLWLSAAEPS